MVLGGISAEECHTTTLYVPDVKAGCKLDSVMLLATLAALIGWYSPLDGARISVA